MPDYYFAVACRHQRALARVRATLPDDGSAVSYAQALGADHGRAASVTVSCGDRRVARLSVNLSSTAADVMRHVVDSEALIAEARRLLAATSPALLSTPRRRKERPGPASGPPAGG